VSLSFVSDALKSQRALVTGASRGIGEAIATGLAAMGAEIVIAADDAEGVERVCSKLAAAGAVAHARQVDLRDPAAIETLVDDAGDLDILVNNAAPGQGHTAFLDTPDEAWELQLDLILWAPLRLIRPIGRAMAKRGSGAIVNISSMSVRDAAPYVAPYAAAKAGLEVITRVAALELGPQGVRVNAIAPSFVPTARVAHLADDPEFLQRAAASVPLGRLATPEDIANAVCWLCSDAASFVNGQVITVDGGMSAGRWRPASDKP
jgi:NAD(P)-dependent dehydrogenase (short-subunit alcohol dehydrogenase family)